MSYPRKVVIFIYIKKFLKNKKNIKIKKDTKKEQFYIMLRMFCVMIETW